MTKYIHIHAKCNAFEIFEQVDRRKINGKGSYPVFNGKMPYINPFTVPTKLTHNSYKLVFYGRTVEQVSTESINREVILKHLIKVGKRYLKVHGFSFSILLIENGETSVLFDYKKDGELLKILS